MNAILQDERLQSLHSAWQGLRFLIENTSTDHGCKIRLLPVSKAELMSELLEPTDGTWRSPRRRIEAAVARFTRLSRSRGAAAESLR